MPETKALISDELKQRVENIAREQNREPADVVEEALGRYFATHLLEELGCTLQRRAVPKEFGKRTSLS